MKMLNLTCYTLCIVCVIAATIIALLLIWSSIKPDILWRGLVTVLVFFGAGALTLTINRTMAGFHKSHAP